MIGGRLGPQEEVLSCRDTLSLILPAKESQAALTRLFLISRLWADAARSLDCWREIQWEAVSKRVAPSSPWAAVHPSRFLPAAVPRLQQSTCLLPFQHMPQCEHVTQCLLRRLQGRSAFR